jgi:pimeloyl-ACP methyl ester carboxylesterase
MPAVHKTIFSTVRPGSIGALVLLVVLCASQSGCLISREQAFRTVAKIAGPKDQPTVKLRSSRNNKTWQSVRGYFSERPEPSDRTELLLRKYSLLTRYEEKPEEVIQWLQELVQGRPTMEEVHALAEIAEIQANWLSQRGKQEAATDMYAVAIVHAYKFLFDPKLDITRNAYDPQFRSICDIYNRSLEGMLRQVCIARTLLPENSVRVGGQENGFELEVKIVGRWSDQEFERFELVNDYQTEGFENQYHRYGLGVPLIAVRKQQAINSPVEKYYPPELTMPMTAFCDFESSSGEEDQKIERAVLTLYDPLERQTVRASSHVVPLESDITTPLAYHLRDPILSSGALATATLFNAELTPDFFGMYMIEPYDPDKIPVVMVHGFWSSPTTWARMFNDLRANPDIHNNYQFWFYSYPTGQPFWLSARQMRNDLDRIRRELDPRGDSPSLDRMILVGHSMGGLVSTLQTMDSGDQFWSMVSELPIDEFTGDRAGLQLLRETFFFEPNDSIHRVISIATPFRGSSFANNATRWASKKLFTLPQFETGEIEKIARQNSDKLKSGFFSKTVTSLDSLAPDAAVFDAMAAAKVSKAVTFHNIVGRVPKRKLLPSSREPELQDDGVVAQESANNPRAVSQIAVPSEHSEVHQHPACIYEVRRILLENLVELDRIRDRNIPELPVDRDASPEVRTANWHASSFSYPGEVRQATVEQQPGISQDFVPSESK